MTLRDAAIDRAKSYVGFQSFANKVNGFGAAAGQDGQAWAGSFLQKVFEESGVHGEPSLVSTVAALAHYTQRNRLYQTPKIGDLVFYNFATDHRFAQPHIGIVTSTKGWRERQVFRAVEGQTSTGMPKGRQEEDGVYERTRYITDVIGFARPAYKDKPEPFTGGVQVTPIHIPTVISGKDTKAVQAIQRALGDTVNARGLNRGVWDTQTVAALARYQRERGLLTNPGTLDGATVDRLAREVRYLRLK